MVVETEPFLPMISSLLTFLYFVPTHHWALSADGHVKLLVKEGRRSIVGTCSNAAIMIYRQLASDLKCGGIGHDYISVREPREQGVEDRVRLCLHHDKSCPFDFVGHSLRPW